MFVHTYPEAYAILLLVTPPIHYIVFAIPHKRHNTFSERKPAIPRWLSFCNSFCNNENDLTESSSEADCEYPLD